MSAIWATGTNTSPIGGAVTLLYTGDAAAAPSAWDSPSGQFRLQFQEDGNLVLLAMPDETVLWASASEGLGGDTLVMQKDGNLVIYDGGMFGTPVWSTETDGNDDAYLVLQNDGNLVIYTPLGLQPLGVFTIPPDWAEGSTEFLEWLTSVTESPQAAEQRMGLRISPRQMFEYGFTVFNLRRTHYDMLNMAAGGSPFYLPVWHDKGTLAVLASAGTTVLNVDTQYTEFQNCTVAVLMANEYDYELVEIQSFTNSTLTLTLGLTRLWSAGSVIYPCKKVRVESQASGERHADKAYRARMRFQSLEKNDSNAEFTFSEYLGNPVLEDEPNEAGGIQQTYNRKEYLLDTKVGLQLLSDVAPFVNQNHPWFAKGRERAWRLRGLLYALQGKRRPIWVPTFFSDFELAEDAADDATSLTVLRCGYSDTGGPFAHRDHILIHLRDGSRLYRKILDAAVVGSEGTFEKIALDAPTGVAITPDDVLRISFITFCRLDTDTIELTHHSDSKGVTSATLVWRTDPGIGGTYSETVYEIPPFSPPEPPVVIDPFRIPDQVLVGFNPFGSLGVAEPPAPDPTGWSAIASQAFLTEEEVGFPNDLIVPNVGATAFSLPLYGSFRVSTRCFFEFDFGIPANLTFRLVLLNTTLDPIVASITIEDALDPQIVSINSSVYRTVAALIVPTLERTRIADVVVDPDLPVKVMIEYITAGWVADTGGPILGMNVYAAPNVDDDPDPYEDGDMLLKIEWWSA